MIENRLKVAVIGLDQYSRLLLQAARESEYFEIVALSDKDSTLAEKIGREYDCNAYDDYRRLITKHEIDCIFVGAGLHSCSEYVRQAIKKNINILKSPPGGRNFEDAIELVKLAEDYGVQLCVANMSRLTESFSMIQQMLEKNEIEQIYLLEVVCNVGGECFPTWHNDRELSGGGVLLRYCYEQIDQMVMLFSLPQEVYCITTNTAGDRQQRHYLTEDTAMGLLKFKDGVFGKITASKVVGPKEKFIKIYGKDKILKLSDDYLLLFDNDGNITEDRQYQYETRNSAKKLVEKYALSLLKPDKNKPYSLGKDNLNNMAVIESAYLSSKTGMPESATRLLNMGHIETANI